jgi:ATP-dependent helicase/nuclease subunit A
MIRNMRLVRKVSEIDPMETRVYQEAALEPIQLTKQQHRAVNEWQHDVLVTAGAGSGKTRTLVARYVAELERGTMPPEIAAITFTEKAAREMRNRVRSEVSRRALSAASSKEDARWAEYAAQMDAARIGTIHSLCVEIIRAHPVEGQVDPGFEVLDEGLSAALKDQVVQESLIWASLSESVAPLFRSHTSNRLSRLLSFLLERRLDAEALFRQPGGADLGWKRVQTELMAFVQQPQVGQAIAGLRVLKMSGALLDDAGPKMAQQIESLLADWAAIEGHLLEEETFKAASRLSEMRRKHMNLQFGKRGSEAKSQLQRLREIYDALIAPWLGGDTRHRLAPDEEIEVLFRENFVRLQELFQYADERYMDGLTARFAMDFDELERRALELLGRKEIRNKWQSSLKMILVDEFQDTNGRQQDIIRALTGNKGSLFVVGDARQSIYRFRGADVIGFRKLQEELTRKAGTIIELDLTFRAHPALLRLLDELLPVIMGIETADMPAYRVPYSSLCSRRTKPCESVRPPFLEVICGVGGSAEQGRSVGARALAHRLIELQEEGQIESWEQVALLFRSSTGFQAYEDAFEFCRIPFVTIAGRGFYDRPEVRDVLNILAALADPSDDLAMAGLLRSPACGLTDEAIYRLRWGQGERRALWESLRLNLSALDEVDRARAVRAHAILVSLQPLVDRLSVAELLKRLIDLSDYRAILASGHSRLWRNLDKLLHDAHASGLVRVGEFLEYIQTLRDVGAREGEAPVEAEGAVRLMTIHKAKGLEFEFVVLADASRRLGAQSPEAFLLPETGLVVRPDRLESDPIPTRLASWIDEQQSQAEADRLLYVALTRAREKIILSGHLSQSEKGLRVEGWMKSLLEAMGADPAALVAKPHKWHHFAIQRGESIGLWVETGEMEKVAPEHEFKWPESAAIPLYSPLIFASQERIDADMDEEVKRNWRATGERIHAPAAIIGRLVHEAIRRWLPPRAEEFDSLMKALALQEGLVDESQRRQAIREARKLLARFWEDPGRLKIEGASMCFHELPFVRQLPEGWTDMGAIDLLVRDGEAWKLIDFKTDEIRDDQGLQDAIERYRFQLKRYAEATLAFLGVQPQAVLCFLDYKGGVEWVDL